MALLRKTKFNFNFSCFLFSLFLFGKDSYGLLLKEQRGQEVGDFPSVEHYSAEVNLIFTVGRWNYGLDVSCKICEKRGKVMKQSAPYQKVQFLFSFILICHATSLSIISSELFLFCCNPQYKLVLLLEKYLFLCKYPRGYFVSKCQDTVQKLLMIFKDNNNNRNIHFIMILL